MESAPVRLVECFLSSFIYKRATALSSFIYKRATALSSFIYKRATALYCA